MSVKVKIIISVVALATAFATGRWLAPTKVKIETKIVEVEKKTEDTKKDKNKHQKTTIIEVTKPDGTKEKTTTITEDTDTHVDTSKTEDDSKSQTNTKEVTRSYGKVNVSALGGVSISDPTLLYGASVTAQVLGPVSIGVWGLSNLTFGASVGLSF